MSDRRPNRIRPRDDNEQSDSPSSSALALLRSGEQSDESTAAPFASRSARPGAATQTAGVQPLAEQMRKKQRRSPRFSSPLNQLATVELQLMLQFLDKRSKLKAARCSR